MRALRTLIAVAFVASPVVAGSSPAVAAGPPAVRELVGTLRLAPGSCSHGRPSGSYLGVTFGTRAIRNSSSNCAGGAYTLLSPGQSGLTTQGFAGSISDPARFDGRDLVLASASQGVYAAPRIYLIGNRVIADVRPVEVRYNAGDWPVGAERATGRYNPSSRQLTLQWFSGESFTSASAGTGVHLSGSFVGSIRRVARGTTVNLGTASFAAGGSAAMVRSATDRSAAGAAGAKAGSDSRHPGKARLVADQKSTSTGSPIMFLLAEVLVLANIAAFIALSRKRGRK
jgi:hypothetical protein